MTAFLPGRCLAIEQRGKQWWGCCVASAFDVNTLCPIIYGFSKNEKEPPSSAYNCENIGFLASLLSRLQTLGVESANEYHKGRRVSRTATDWAR